MRRTGRVEPDDIQIRQDVAAAVAVHDAEQVSHGVTVARISVLDYALENAQDQRAEIEDDVADGLAGCEIVGGTVESIRCCVSVVVGVVEESVYELLELFRFPHGEVVEGVGGIGGELYEVVEVGGCAVQECV